MATAVPKRRRKSVMGTSLHPDVITIIDGLAFERRTTPASLIREAIHTWLKDQGYPVPETD